MEIYSGQEYLEYVAMEAAKKQLTIAELCELAQISERSFRRWAKDIYSPKISDIQKLISLVKTD